MARIDFHAVVDTDKDQILFTMSVDGQPAAHAYLEASEAETLLGVIASQRQLLKDEVGRDLDPGSRLLTVYDPVWRTTSEHSGPEGIVLTLRHPGFGWQSFLFPKNEAANLGKWLVENSGGENRCEAEAG